MNNIWLEQYSELSAQLINLGYHNYQIRSIIEDTLGVFDVDTISPEQAEIIVQVLNDYIAFAHSARIHCQCK